jgi:hypothetical protein
MGVNEKHLQCRTFRQWLVMFDGILSYCITLLV